MPETLVRPETKLTTRELIAASIECVARAHGFDALVFDHYGLARPDHDALAGGRASLVIDDLANRPLGGDVVREAQRDLHVAQGLHLEAGHGVDHRQVERGIGELEGEILALLGDGFLEQVLRLLVERGGVHVIHAEVEGEVPFTILGVHSHKPTSAAGAESQRIYFDWLAEKCRAENVGGRPVVLSFVYTSCYYVCPSLTLRLRGTAEVARDALGERLRQKGQEFGSVTGRPRRCGWFDAAGLKRAVQLNGTTGLCITKLDVLDGMAEIRICTGYMVDGTPLPLLPSLPRGCPAAHACARNRG